MPSVFVRFTESFQNSPQIGKYNVSLKNKLYMEKFH